MEKEKSQIREAMLTIEQLEKEYPFVDLMLDAGFKHVFCRPANKEILLEFLNSIIPDRTIVDINYSQNEQVPENIESRASRFDLHCTTDDGTHIIVEMQRNEQRDYIERSIYYSGLPMFEQVRIGYDRYHFKPIYSVNILNFTLEVTAHREEVLSAFRYKEIDDNTLLSDRKTLIYIELPKFKKRVEELDRENVLEIFYFCLRNISKLKKIPSSLQSDLAKRIFLASATAAMTTTEKMQYIRAMNTKRDIENQIQFAEEKGIEIGVEKGVKEEKNTIARKLKSLGIEMSAIIESTGLTKEQIEAL